jgi:hypothetical protein
MEGFASSAVLDPERLARVGNEPQRAFPDGVTLAELARLSPRDFLAACMEAGRTAARELSKRARERGLIDETTKSSPSRRLVIGVQSEGEALAHVLYRWEGPDADAHPTRVNVSTVRLIHGDWRVCMDHELAMHVSPMLAFHAFEHMAPEQP